MNSDNLIGNILNGRYDVIEKIGTGGMASVYKAKDTLLNRYVAIKVLRDALEGEKNIVTNFIKEAQSSASLTHNNIVSVFDVGEDDGVNYMVMELVDGRTLKDYIKEKGALPWQEACDYCIQIGQGLMEAHSKNIIHRDIKPQNIIMTKDKTLKVTDFGIARALTSDTTIVGGTALGSVHYISPEQARGGFTDARSDIYSLGIVLYEMLTGKVPFDGGSAVSVALMHLEKEPVNVRCVNLSIPQDLAYVTMKAIAKEQANRYQSVAQMLEDLHAVLADEPLVSKETAKKTENITQVYGGGFKKDEPDEYIEPTEEIDDSDNYTNDDYADDDVDDFSDVGAEDEPVVGRRAKKERKKEEKPTEEAIEEIEPKRKKKKQKSPQQKKADRLATLLALATVLVLIIIAAGVFFGMHLAKDVKIPDVYNMTVDEAIDTIKNVGLSVADDIEYASSDSIADGNVITQSPKAGTRISKDQKVELVVSTGSSGGDVEVPDVTGMEFDDAIKALSDKNLNYAVIEDYSDSVDMGEVIRQSPLKGTKLNEHDEVTLHVSKGKTSAAPTEGPSATKVTVPSLNGETKESAEAKLQEAGLVRGAISYKYSESMENFIISQSPETGKLVDPGSKVNIVISRGSKSDSEEADNEESDNEEAQEKKTETKTETKATAKPSDEDEETEKSSSKKQEFTVKIPDGAGDTVNVEIVANGKTVHNDMHDKSEGSVTVTIEGEGSVKVQAYIDGAKVADKTLEFD